jgi:hypothetical protein
MNLIQKVTADCSRDDCSISTGSGVSTCVAWQPTYDRNGNRTDRGDPNSHTTNVSCRTCRRSWTASTRFNETTISENAR